MKALEVPRHCVQLIRLELPVALPDEISHWYVTPIRVTGQEPIHQILDIGKVSAPSLPGSLMPLGNLLKSEAGTLDDLEKRLRLALQELRAQFDRVAGWRIQDGMHPAAQSRPGLEHHNTPARLGQPARGSEASYSASHHYYFAGQSAGAIRIGGLRSERAAGRVEPATARRRGRRRRGTQRPAQPRWARSGCSTAWPSTV